MDVLTLGALVGTGCFCIAVFLVLIVAGSFLFRSRRKTPPPVAGIAPAPARGAAVNASLTRMEHEGAALPPSQVATEIYDARKMAARTPDAAPAPAAPAPPPLMRPPPPVAPGGPPPPPAAVVARPPAPPPVGAPPVAPPPPPAVAPPPPPLAAPSGPPPFPGPPPPPARVSVPPAPPDSGSPAGSPGTGAVPKFETPKRTVMPDEGDLPPPPVRKS